MQQSTYSTLMFLKVNATLSLSIEDKFFKQSNILQLKDSFLLFVWMCFFFFSESFLICLLSVSMVLIIALCYLYKVIALYVKCCIFDGSI